MSLTVHPYRSTDRERVAALTEAALRDAGAYFDEAPVHGDPGGYLEREGAEFLVGTVDGTVVATGAFRPPEEPLTSFGDLPPDVVELKRMHVHPEHQRRGYASEILAELTDRAREAGYGEVVSLTTAVQAAALAFYAEHGFAEIGRKRVSLGSETLELVALRRGL